MRKLLSKIGLWLLSISGANQQVEEPKFEDIHEWVKKRLGDPVVSVELTSDQVAANLGVAAAEWKARIGALDKVISATSKQLWIRNYTLALSMETLAFIRGKIVSIPIPGGDHITLNADMLLGRSVSMKDELEEGIYAIAA